MKNHSTLNQQKGQSDKETEQAAKPENEPSEMVIKNIMSYSRSLVVFKSKFSGNVNLILN
ncbi:MAG: hypothetical protein K9G67_10505 [Bacteroidales bacterium]|nr:hypothetical protein [Bacteroidales bacterium]MCF8343440.1 hypothetical protein [Bacteroidales bacterium]MCF8349895.1 hypothetical protein [Bacteroidales bacterium]MCF8376776.1 hypothetical protein [Bacteroidales bacterium]